MGKTVDTWGNVAWRHLIEMTGEDNSKHDPECPICRMIDTHSEEELDAMECEI